MAWPLTPFRSMNNGTTFWDDAFGNALQTGVNGIVAGTYSLAAFVVDGTGGAVVTPTAGTGKLSASASGTSAPTPAFTTGLIYADAIPAAMVRYNLGGGVFSFTRGFNISSGVRTSPGVATFTLRSAIASWQTAFILVSNNGQGVNGIGAAGNMTGSTTLVVETFDTSAANHDNAFDTMCVVFGL